MPIREGSLTTVLEASFFNVNVNTLETGPFANPFGGACFVLTLIAATTNANITSVSLIDNSSGNVIYNDINKKNMFFIEQFAVATDYVISNAILDAKNFSMILPLPSNFLIEILYTAAPVVPANTSMLVISGGY